MLRIIIDPFEDVDNLDELVVLSDRVKQQYGLLKKPDSFMTIREQLEYLQNKHKLIIFRAFIDSQLEGFLLLLVNTPKFGIPWTWHPIVFPGKNERSTAVNLLKRCIKFAKKRDITRLEVCFSIENEAHEKLYLKQLKWYEALGFYPLAEEVNMELLLDNYVSKPIKLPDNYKLETLSPKHQKILPQIASKVFNESEDKMFLDLGEDEKWIMCQKYFESTDRIIQDASYVLIRKGKIIGFSIMKANGNEAEVQPIGIIPKYRNKGLAKILILSSINQLIKTGFTRALLDVMMTNKPAYTFYIKLGFKLNFTTLIYAFNC
jgi:ribosomal protein S18 acetylase RimI-like enzyme